MVSAKGWFVPLKNAGPSRKMAPGMEGPPEKRRTFQENGLWHGRSPGKTQDLPGKWLLAWKVEKGWFFGTELLIGRGSPRKVPFWWMVKAGSGAGRHEATCHPRLGGACEATASQRQGRRGSPVPPGLAESKGQAGGGRRCRPGSLQANGRGGITGVFSPGGKTYTACIGKRDPARRACGPRRVRGKTPGNCARNDNCPSRNCLRRRRAGGCWRCA